MSRTTRLTALQALVRYLSAQLTEEGEPFIAGVWAIFGHGNVAGLGEALHASRDALPTWRGHNEQTMAHAAIAYAKLLEIGISPIAWQNDDTITVTIQPADPPL